MAFLGCMWPTGRRLNKLALRNECSQVSEKAGNIVHLFLVLILSANNKLNKTVRKL